MFALLLFSVKSTCASPTNSLELRENLQMVFNYLKLDAAVEKPAACSYLVSRVRVDVLHYDFYSHDFTFLCSPPFSHVSFLHIRYIICIAFFYNDTHSTGLDNIKER